MPEYDDEITEDDETVVWDCDLPYELGEFESGEGDESDS